ncbi:MAG: MoaD/ThiS family protein [bacterium]
MATVTVRIPQPLQKLTSGKEEVTATGSTIREIIESLETDYRGIKERLCDGNGTIRRFVNIYANDEDCRFLGNLDTELKDNDVVSIVPAIAGGMVEPGDPGLVKKNSSSRSPRS